MRYLTIFLIAIFISPSIRAQTYELGGFVGGSNFIGDVGSTSYISPNKPAFGALFKWNRSDRHSFRFSAILTELEGLDSESHEARRQTRDLSFTSSLVEFSLGLEYTFWEFDMFKDRYANAPYLYSGITVLNHDNNLLRNGDLINDERDWNAAIPIVLGYKISINSQIIIALEAGARYSFTDAIDGNDPIGNDDGIRFGNLNNDDWYMFTGATITFAFGRRPCFCAF